MTHLLTTVVEGRAHRDKMMAQRDPRETASMIRSRNGTPRATSLEAERIHCAGETENAEAIAARGRPGRKQNERSPTLRRGEATDKKFENTCRRKECRRLEREGQRWHVVNGWRSGDKRKTKTFGTVSPGTGQNNCKGWRGSDPRKPVLPRESVSKSRDRSQVQNASSVVPQFCGRGKTGARRGRRGRRGNRAVPEHELQPRTTCERWRGPTGGPSLLPTSGRKVGR